MWGFRNPSGGGKISGKLNLLIALVMVLFLGSNMAGAVEISDNGTLNGTETSNNMTSTEGDNQTSNDTGNQTS
ncbi:hypothetical protein, partial [Methanothermobacter sp. K4]|uniref:hypothetical protein n=1 Tax=Methanothermobacter sp. K4 TaxID=2913262 RepID=UPI001EDBF9CA